MLRRCVVEDLVADLQGRTKTLRRHSGDVVGLCSLLKEIDDQLQFCVQPAQVAALGWCSIPGTAAPASSTSLG